MLGLTYSGSSVSRNSVPDSPPTYIAGHKCPICTSSTIVRFHQDKRREYYRCHTCELVFVPREYYLSPQDEKAEYDLHQNSPDDARYRRFLDRLYQPMQERLMPESDGLDFGSGPGPTLSVMFEEAGHHVALYDPFYAPEPLALTRQYDFITASEVVEHLRDPRAELERLWVRLKPGGLLGIVTKRVIDREAFSRWHYKDDMTHISFFSLETFEWLAIRLNADLDVIGKDVVILTK